MDAAPATIVLLFVAELAGFFLGPRLRKRRREETPVGTATMPRPRKSMKRVNAWARDVRIGTRLINARSETIHTKPSFGTAFRSCRCLVPADGWFEWQRTGYGKRPYFLGLEDESPLSFAALWEHWGKGNDSIESFTTIITTTASPELVDIHHRQPAIIGPDRFDDWLDPTSSVSRLLDLVREPYCSVKGEKRRP